MVTIHNYGNYYNLCVLGTFIQPATTVESPSVCVGSSQTFNCTVKTFITAGIGYVITDAEWSRDGDVITDSTPHNTLLRTQHGYGPVVTGLMVDNVALIDNGTVYTCTAVDASDDITSNVTLNVVGGTCIYLMCIYIPLKPYFKEIYSVIRISNIRDIYKMRNKE